VGPQQQPNGALPSSAPDEPASSAPAQPRKPKPTVKPRPKQSDVDLGALQSKIHCLRAAGQLSKLTVTELKAYLKFKGQGVSGKKPELETRLLAVLDATESATVAEE
jgi:SAP domain